jgi:hypothetical protein
MHFYELLGISYVRDLFRIHGGDGGKSELKTSLVLRNQQYFIHL